MPNAFETVLARLNEAGSDPKAGVRGYMARCPAHDDRDPSMNVDQGVGGRVILRCYAGCSTQAILDALGLTWGHLFPDGAPYQDPRGPKLPALPPVEKRIREPIEPVPDRDLLLRILDHAIENVVKGAADRWLKKRGVTRATALKWGVGFMPWYRHKKWKAARKDLWIIPIANHEGRLVALKTHREDPPPGWAKSGWIPLGTEPESKPRHGFSTLWPCPESFAVSSKLYLLPGELKALAVLGAGRNATSITAGESMTWAPKLVKRLEGRKIVIVYDDDEAGRRFLTKTTFAIRGRVVSLSKVTFGQKGKNSENTTIGRGGS